MEIKVLICLVLLSVLLFTINGAISVNGHQVLSSHGLAGGDENCFSFHAMPRKLMLNPKVEGFDDKYLVFEDEDSSAGESHKTEEISKVTMQEGSAPARMFTMDYTPVRKRRPVHNKSLPAASTTSP